MADVFSAVINPLVDELIKDANSLLKQNYKLIQGVEEDVKKLTSILTSIQAVLQDAEEKQLESPELSNWLGKLEEIVYDSEDVLQTLATETLPSQKKKKLRVFGSSKVSDKLNGALAIKEILRRLYAIEKEKEVFHLNVNVGIRTSDDRITSHIVDKPDIFGRESDLNNIIDRLLSEESDIEGEISVIPLIGMGGVGKTAVAQLVYNDERLEKRYPVMMWVCVTENYDHRKICKDMIESHSKMKLDDSQMSENQLESRLLDILKKNVIPEKNRFLLVLDDVWNDSLHVWKKLETILKQGVKGSKVLVTSRNTRVSEVMGTEPSYPLGYMSEDDCWLLFEKITFYRSSISSSMRRVLEDIGKQIVEKCKGLPLAVRAIGGLLRGVNDVAKWRKILQHDIWEAEGTDTGTGKPVILPALRLSYDHLPSDLKRCFVYCSLFPKAHVFRKAELVKLWKAESLITPRPRYKIDDIGGEYFDELLSRSLFQLLDVDSRVTYRMHDLIHDLALSVSSPYFYQIKDINDRCPVPDKVRHLALLGKDAPHIMDQLGRFKKLRTLLSPVEHPRDFRPVLDKLFHTWKFMRTLDLSSSMITKLPESVEELKLLTFLDLSKTEIRNLPNSLCKLYNLQTLKLLGCLWLFELPKDFGNLSNLEHLELEDMFWQKSLKLPSNIGSLKNLQNLHVYRLGQKRGYGIEELKNMLNLKGSLHISKLENARKTGEASLKDKESLVKVTFEWSSSVGSPQDEVKHREMIEDLQPHPNVEEIQILRYQGNTLPSWLRDSGVENLTTLSLKHCSNCKILSLGQLPHLQKLVLKGLVKLEEWSEGQYGNLRRLKISSCPKLKLVPSCFVNLYVLKITKCDSLEALPLTPSLHFLILVDNLVMKDFNEQNVRLASVDDQGVRRITVRPSFISLLEMKIVNCSKFQQLPEIFAPQKLDIIGCPLITALPTSDFSTRLQHLAISGCDGRLVATIPDTVSLYSLVISNIKDLNSLPKLSCLPGLRALYIHGCKDLVSLSDAEDPLQGLNSLQFLSVRDCPKLETLTENTLPISLTCLIIGSCSSLKSIGPKDVLKNLNSLKDLYIEHCRDLGSLPEEGVPTSLQHFRIEGSPLLMSRCQESRPDWPKIMNIPDLELLVS